MRIEVEGEKNEITPNNVYIVLRTSTWRYWFDIMPVTFWRVFVCVCVCVCVA